MSREIKFRAWDIDSKSFLKGDFSLGITSGEFRGKYGEVFKNVIVIQFSGLKDKRGVEIYEGDIFFIDRVKEKPEHIGHVIFDTDFSSFVVNKTNGGWEFLHDFLDNNKTSFIGSNIHKNTELL